MIRKLFLCAALSLLGNCSLSGQIPAQANKYKAAIIRETHFAWGLAGQPGVFAAQITQESGWNPNAKSGVGAVGLSQFMPSTTSFISATYPKQLGGANPLDPNWSLRALIWYDRWLWNRLGTYQEGSQNRIAASLASYNAGLGWILKASKNAAGCDKSLWWDCAENTVDARTAANRKQSRDYPRRILLVYYPRFKAAGW